MCIYTLLHLIQSAPFRTHDNVLHKKSSLQDTLCNVIRRMTEERKRIVTFNLIYYREQNMMCRYHDIIASNDRQFESMSHSINTISLPDFCNKNIFSHIKFWINNNKYFLIYDIIILIFFLL